MRTGTRLGQWRPMLEASRDRTLKTSTHGAIVLTHATGARMVAVWTLAPAPKDPVLHLEAVNAINAGSSIVSISAASLATIQLTRSRPS